MVVVYKSNSGYSKAYAELLADALDLNVYNIDELPDVHKVMTPYSSAGSLPAQLSDTKAAKNLNLIAAVGVGMSLTPPKLFLKLQTNAKFRLRLGFYLQGGFDINKLKGPNKA